MTWVDRLVGSALVAFAAIAGISCSATRDSVAAPKDRNATPRAIEANSTTIEIPPIVGLSVRDAMAVCSWAELEIQTADGDGSRPPKLDELFATIASIPAKDPQP